MKKRYRRIYLTQYSLLALILIAVVGLVIAGVVILGKVPYKDHFAIPWAAGRAWLLEGESPYGDVVGDTANSALDELSFDAQLPGTKSFSDLVFNLLFYLPFSLLPFTISRTVWFALSVITVGFIGYFSLKLSEWKVTLLEKILLIALVILSFPGIKTAVSGRLTPLIVLLLYIGLDALNRGKDTLAGFILSLTFGSLTTSALVVLFLLAWSVSRKRWAILKAYFAGLAFLWAISLLLIPSWPKDWFRAVLPLIENWDWIQTPLMDLSMILPGISQPLSLALHGIFAVVFITIFFTTLKRTGLEFTWKVLAIFVLTFLFHIKSSVYSLFLVMPAFFLVLRFWTERWRIFGRILSWVIIVGLAAATWFYARPDYSFILDQRFPILIAGLPLAILAGMVTIRWWAIQIPRLPYEQAQDN